MIAKRIDLKNALNVQISTIRDFYAKDFLVPDYPIAINEPKVSEVNV